MDGTLSLWAPEHPIIRRETKVSGIAYSKTLLETDAEVFLAHSWFARRPLRCDNFMWDILQVAASAGILAVNRLYLQGD